MLLAVRLVFIALIPLGVFTLLTAIKLLRASFFGDIQLEAALRPGHSRLRLPDDGLYAIWLRGAKRQLAAVQGFKPVIRESATGNKVALSPTIAQVYASGMDGGHRTQAFTFEALAGEYTLEMSELAPATGAGNLLAGFFAGNAVDPAKLSMQIRKTKPFYYGLGSILLCVLSGFLIIGGFIFSLLADKFVNAQP